MFPDLDRVFLFCAVQHFKPEKIYEIGSGESTEVVRAALKASDRDAKHLAIEPYRSADVPAGVKILTQEIQVIKLDAFDDLSANDILFIDSSHVTMPYGDTLTEFLTILPTLQRGVLVHIHDIFLPYDYMPGWARKNYVYTEQWLVALMLYGASEEWEVVWASRLMMTEYFGELLRMKTYPLRKGQTRPNGGSLWIRKLGRAIRT